MEQNFAEPLHEYGQFAQIIKKLLQFRHQKHAQLEITQDTLESKRVSWEDLERTEREASRLEEALGRGRATAPSEANGSVNNSALPDQQTESEVGTSEARFTPPYPATGPPPRRSGSGMGLLNALSYTIHGMMDTDPESARRNGISKTRENISQVCRNNTPRSHVIAGLLTPPSHRVPRLHSA